MTRKRLTQVFPFLTPLRQWQKKQCFYLKMRMDGNTYAEETEQSILPYVVYETETLVINPNSGMDIQYQYNKLHNLQVVSGTMNHILIRPYETFSFWNCARYAHLYGKYKDGLVLSDGKLTACKGGGLCQMSNTLFYAFLHTPLQIIERHPHMIEDIPSPDSDTPYGTDATVNEGWQDLKVTNRSDATYQIIITFKDDHMKVGIYSDTPFLKIMKIRNGNVRWYRKNGKIYQDAEVYRDETDIISEMTVSSHLYDNHTEIGYPLDASIYIEEEEQHE